MVCFLCGKAGHGATRCPDLNEAFPFMLPGWMADKVGGGYIMISVMKWRLFRGGRSAARISNGTRPQDAGGGEAQLTASWDVVSRGWCFSLLYSW